MRPLLGIMSVALLLAVCSVSCTAWEEGKDVAAAGGVETQETEPIEDTLAQGVTEEIPKDLGEIYQAWTGDFDGMVERRLIRALVTFSKTNYFLDGGAQKGITYEGLKLFEDSINEQLGTGHLKVHVVIIPVQRDRLIPALVEGKGDLSAANLTITPGRLEVVDFSNPLSTGVNEIVVSGPGSPAVETVEDLSGKEVVVRASSSYYESLQLLNELFENQGKPPVEVTPAAEYLETEDLLEMVNAGLVPLTVADTYLAEFWSQVFENIELHPEVMLGKNAEIGWAFRKNSPKLRQAVNAFVKEHKIGTLMGNMMFKRYLRSTKWVERSLSGGARKKFTDTIVLFQKYAAIYEFDWIMLAALGYQESRLDQSLRSHAGAIGVMQLLPSTAADPNVNIPNIEELEPNIHAGTKYLRFLRDRYFENEPMTNVDKTLLTFASYNAGPARVRGLRKKAEAMGFDPNVWFDNVEVVAAKEIGRETVQYVSNIAKYYVAYERVVKEMKRKGDFPTS